ncbi:hypothetical protein BDB00DRAFT_299269 [Zychaea mexicana]|uniref:uncharacterized protein n=1 Tax=Zychaea mexicana TaxID=64656 RepID=UPI0022FEB9EE|nr:uncharacterized protein BDB00DRAFT_299269 [Zychaea mexicana]KAI9494663.1 hypothetical protein BDB00DRAFT_299269 [Zychaea mexicana]
MFDFAIGSTDEDIDNSFSRLVMKFSLAQRKGFMMAFEQTFPFSKIDPRSLPKGCYYHWRQSVQHLITNHAVVAVEKVTDFQDLTNTMYDVDGESGFQLAVNQLRKEFPNAERWLDRWTQDGVAAMIFKSRRGEAQKKTTPAEGYTSIDTRINVFTALQE